MKNLVHKNKYLNISVLQITIFLIITIFSSFYYKSITLGALDSESGTVKQPYGEFKTFTSQSLGISFDYAAGTGSQQIHVKQIGKRVYLYIDYTNTDDPTKGKYIEVFSKDPKTSLTNAVKKQFLSGYITENCPVVPAKISSTMKNPAREYIQITIPMVNNQDMQQRLIAEKQCPPEYTFNRRTGSSYFMSDANHSDKFIFFNLGQDNFLGTPPNSSGIGLTWDQTIKYID